MTNPDQTELMPDLEPSKRPKRKVEERVEGDFYATVDRDPIRSLLVVDGERIRAAGSVCELAVGAGDIAEEVQRFGLPVYGFDIQYRGWPNTCLCDYFDLERSPAKAIITNPPYNLINAKDSGGRWLRHALNMPGWEYMALLLNWDWPAAKMNGLGALLDQYPFSYAYLLRFKVDFTGEGSPPQRNAWFVWDRLDPRGPMLREPGFRFLDRLDDRQKELF